MEALNILWQIIPKSQGTIGNLIVIAEGGLRHHRRLEIEVEVEGDQSQHRGRGSTMSEIVDRPMPLAPTRAYTMKARED